MLTLPSEYLSLITTFAPVFSERVWQQAQTLLIGELIEAKKVTPVIGRCYTLSEVSEAIRYLEEGHARGKVVITLGHNSKT